ncbi:MAG: helix-turn-helix domain-containing protein [Gemmatimonadetes bacterium]|nr:winged helix-turn-helix transcriptional regulator [Gemmatimonadota bacterium]NIR80963.1 winged helix-turn-helix transcriptional regulator [Gemmatimonadota bacterium]NIT89781.1 winged helix-turn-helix transcriptional regulator [Gemmatimonadota bacterium]NIU33567.1 winged helix-turn-helix transcriptional regulator [Gemmatimonadota bacterium]NIU37836.1 helix-turn-helix domain-containing protein [Gemmatimonadota bacterium]
MPSGERTSNTESEPGALRLAELDRAHRRMRLAAAAIDPVAAQEGWPAPFSPVRLLILRHLRDASPWGAKPSRIARALEMKRSSLAHHLDVLEASGLIVRGPRGFYDGRQVAVRLTDPGTYALWRLGSALPSREARAGRSEGPTA